MIFKLGGLVNIHKYENGDNCISVNHYKIVSGGHGIAGVNGNMDIIATEVIWDFVSQYNIRCKYKLEINLRKILLWELRNCPS